MNFLKKLFGVKEIQQEVAQPIQEKKVDETFKDIVQSNAEQQPLQPTGDEEICEMCGLPIMKDQKGVHKFGKAYHAKPCFRNIMKEAKKQAFG